MTPTRLDVALVDAGLARSRTAAASAIADGRVRLGGRVVTRASAPVPPGVDLEVEPGSGWVGRGAVKLAAALDAFAVDPRGRFALDLGASTGGFTQVLLQRGARRVVALDVGHDQLVPELRADPRVVPVERENARHLTAPRFAAITGSGEAPGLVVADLSFISLTLVLPAIVAVVHPEADVVLLVKPQFEVGRERLSGGLVPRAADRAAAVRDVLGTAFGLGLGTAGVAASPVPGLHGNREALVHLHRSRGGDPAEWTGPIERATRDDGGEAS